jgi:Tfp pilus assembly protein PilV
MTAFGKSQSRARRGVSLIEALVAMAVMAFGMLGVVGLQATLRGHADMSRQRTEATRIAQERIEGLRNFSVLETTAGAQAFADKVTFASTTVTGYTTNTTYTVSGAVTPTGAAAHKTLVVDVSWADRTGATQTVRLMSAMAQIAPGLGASMVTAPQGGGGVREPEGRRRGIPPQAKNFGDSTSGFRPPQATGTVAWVFNNTTGLITSICTTAAVDNATLTLASLTGCVTSPGLAYQLISGYIRFATTATAAGVTDPTGAVAPAGIEVEVDQTFPTTGTRNCFHEYAATYVAFFCAVPVTIPTPATWSGRLQVKASTLPTLSPNLADVTPANRKVCRYRADASYVAVDGPRANENLVVIAAPLTCPTPPTYPHQPAA